MTDWGGESHKCPVCGTRFTVLPYQSWGWAYGGRLTCSYHCMRALRAKDMRKLAGGIEGHSRPAAPPFSEEERGMIRRLYLTQTPVAHIARRLHRSPSAIRYYLRKVGLIKNG